MDNRPLRFEEFIERTGQAILLSATPGPWELEHSANVVEQVIRPTGLVDPEVDIRPTTGQIDDLRERIEATVAAGEPGAGHHADQEDGRGPDRLPRRAGRPGAVPPLRRRHHGPHRDPARPAARACSTSWSGINLLREGLDLPEVALVAILDADKEGFLRSASSLIQTMGRAARNVDGRVVMYADTGHRLDDRRHRGDPAPPGPADRLQPGTRHRSAVDHQVGHRHPQAATSSCRPIRPRANASRCPTTTRFASAPSTAFCVSWRRTRAWTSRTCSPHSRPAKNEKVPVPFSSNQHL